MKTCLVVLASFDVLMKNIFFLTFLQPYSEGQRQMTRGIVAVEMLHLSRNGIMEFRDTPPISEVRLTKVQSPIYKATHFAMLRGVAFDGRGLM